MSALPATMACVEIKQPGGPEALVRTTRPVPHPKDGEILIKVAAAGVNRPDLAQRAGLYPRRPVRRICQASRQRVLSPR
jgi:NADPH:quinone reductase